MASTLSSITANTIDNADEAAVTKFVDIMTAAFERVAITMCFIVERDNTPPPYPSPLIDRARVREHVQRIEQMAKDGAILLEAGDWSALALWEPPDFKGAPFSESQPAARPLQKSFRHNLRQVKEKYLGTEERNSEGEVQLRPFYHLGFLGRNPDKPGVPGSIAAVMNPLMEKARQENVPVWLEATTPKAVKVYEHFGFRTVETIITGTGQINVDGWPEEGGAGCPLFAMIADDHLRHI